MDADKHCVVHLTHQLGASVLVGFFPLRDRDRVIRVRDLRALTRHDDPDSR